MSKLTRVFQKQFGVNAGNSDVGIFGSLAASNPQYSKDPETIQSLNAFLTGWAAETIANNRPALEDFNAIDFLTFYQLCYLLQTGVAEWNAETTYYIGSIVNNGTGVLYKSLANDNLNNAVTDAAKWAELAPADPFSERLFHARDEKASGTGGGAFTSGGWRTRVLNAVKTNEISGASLASNQITLPAGTYFIQAYAQGGSCGLHVAKLKNITDDTDEIIGQYNDSGFAGSNWAGTAYSFVSGRFTITGQKVFELQHRCTHNGAFGAGLNFDVTCVFADIKIWKVA